MIFIDTETLNQILGDTSPHEPTFLQDKAEVINSTGEAQISEQVPEAVEPKKYKCKKCDESFDTLPELMRHSKNHHTEPKTYCCKYGCGLETGSLTELMRHYKECPKRGVDEQSDSIENIDSNTEVNKMADGDNLPQIVDDDNDLPVDVEEAKPKSKKTKNESDISQIPSDYDRMKSILYSFGVPNYKGILEGMKLRQMDDINALKDLLRSVGTPVGKIDSIAGIWTEYIGKKPENVSTSVPVDKKTTGSGEALSLMQKLREEEISDSIVENYKTRLEDKRLDMELKRKRLSGEYMENQNKQSSEVDALRLQLELMKMQMQQNHQQTNPQNELLKQQLELMRQEFAELRRKSEEEARIRQIEENHRREIESLKDLVKMNGGGGDKPKTDDLLIKRMEELQAQHDKELTQLKNELITTQKEKEFQYKLDALMSQSKQIRDEYQGQLGSLAESLKDFATNQKHESEILRQEVLHERQMDEIKKKLEEEQHNRALSNEQYVFERTTKTAEEVGKSIANAMGSLGETLKPSVDRNAELMSSYDRAQLAINLKSQGFTPDQITAILNQPQKRQGPIHQGVIKEEWDKMDRAVNNMSDTVNNVTPAEPLPNTNGEVKFIGNEGE